MEVENIYGLNVNSINSNKRKKAFLKLFCDKRPDIFCISETHFNSKTKFFINGYNIFRNDRISNGGGTAIILNNKIKFKNLRKTNGSFEAISVDILLDGRWTSIISIYIPKQNLDIIEFHKFLETCESFICVGDFNARMTNYGDISNNHNGKILQDYFDQNNLITPFTTKYPTCYRSDHGSKIDFFILSNNIIGNIDIGQELSFSDHSLIYLLAKFKINELDLNSEKILYNYGYANIGKINEFIEGELHKLKIEGRNKLNINDLESIAVQMDSIFRNAIKNFVPIQKSYNGIKLSNQSMQLKREFRKISRKIFNGKTKHFSANYQNIKSQYTLIKNMYLNSIKFDICNFYKYYISKASCNLDMYEIIKKTTPNKRFGKFNSNEIMDSERNVHILNTKETNDLFAKHFIKKNHNNNEIKPSNMDGVVNNYCVSIENFNNVIDFNDEIYPLISDSDELNVINSKLSLEFDGILTCKEEISLILNKRKPKKSHGCDSLPISIIKHFNDKILDFITIYFNHLLANGYFPNVWKLAILIPIPKAGKNINEFDSHRPISQLPSISKIFEKLINNRLTDYCNDNAILPEKQFGFRNKLSTYHPLSKFTMDIVNGLNGGKITTAIALDIKCAFDTIWHNGLLYKMNEFGFNGLLIKMIKNFLSNRKIAVGNGNQISDAYAIEMGVPQGAVLSPVLFNIFLTDIPNHNIIKTLQFADDIIFYVPHRAPLAASNIFNSFLEKIQGFYTDWKLEINISKTCLINFYGNNKTIKSDLIKKNKARQVIKMNDQQIVPSGSIKYLGINFSTNFRFNKHIDYSLNKARSAFYGLHSILRNQLIEPNFKLFVYKTYLRPIMTYGSPIWCNPTLITSHQMERFRIFERMILRKALNIKRPIGSYKFMSNTNLYKLASIDTFDKFTIKQNVNYFTKCENSENQFLRGLIEPYNEKTYLTPSYSLQMFKNNELFVNDNLLIFHRGFHNPHKLVYYTNK